MGGFSLQNILGNVSEYDIIYRRGEMGQCRRVLSLGYILIKSNKT